MIDSRELRIGNFVKCTVHLPIGYYRPDLSATKVSEIRDSYVETDTGIHKYRDIAPLALTEDILIDSGGKKVSDNEISFVNNEGTENVENFSIIKDSDKFYLSSSDGKELSIAIEYVHQFQNIYFDIKGKEIKLVLPQK